MDKKTMDVMFEPFFTTKEVGKGTGLGLAMVYGLVKQHDGNILVYSEPGKGTTFKIYLPLIEGAKVEGELSQPAELKGGTETILVAEDNEDVRNLFKNVLESFGYRVITAEDGPDAVNKFNENKDAVRLCILDVIMPKKSGKAVLDEINKISPDIRALFISGYTAEVLDRQEILDRGFHFISKPVSPETLLQKVRAILDIDSVK
jgi:CheY-like chemotaxis protein